MMYICAKFTKIHIRKIFCFKHIGKRKKHTFLERPKKKPFTDLTFCKFVNHGGTREDGDGVSLESL